MAGLPNRPARPIALSRDESLDGGLPSGAITAIARRMRYAMTILAVLFCLGTQGCVSSDKKVTPPDHVIDPRGQ